MNPTRKKIIMNILFLLIPLSLPFIFYLSSLFYNYEYTNYFFLCFLLYYIYLLFILIFRKQANKKIILIANFEFLLVLLSIKLFYIVFFWFMGKFETNLLIMSTLWILYGFTYIRACKQEK